MRITAKTKICMIIGDPVEHSLSPQMHNAGYVALNIDNHYVYIACHVEVKDLKDFIKGIRAMNIHGVTCTIPHKIAVISYLDKIDEVAEKIGAVNTIVNENGKLIGYNTDWIGILTPLENITSLEGKTVAILGAGGAARAAAYAVSTKKANLTIFNRTLEKAEKLAEDFDAKAYSIDARDRIQQADIIINTTAIGLHPQKNETPLPKDFIKKKHIVFDVVYGKHQTQFIKDAKTQGAQTISGKDMLLYQGLAQFKLFTGYDVPAEAMARVLI